MSKQRILLTDDQSFLGRELFDRLQNGDAYEPIMADAWDERTPVDVMICGDPHDFPAAGWRLIPARCMSAMLWYNEQLTTLWKRVEPRRIITLGHVGQYSDTAATPLHSELLWDGWPASGRRGLLQHLLMENARAYAEEHGIVAQHVILDGLYGPGDDYHSDAQVIPALIHKFVQAVKTDATYVTVHGTGEGARTTKRTFLHIQDAIDGLLLILAKATTSGVINLGSDVSTTIENLTKIICNFSGFTGQVLYDASQPNGRPERLLDNQYVKSLGFQPTRKLVSEIGQLVRQYRASGPEVAPALPSA
jgi:nucleoside-diphosphate-sugar epimerase